MYNARNISNQYIKMRTRIKVIEKNNGDKKYQPQVKDNLTVLDVILFLPVLIVFGKFIWRYVGLNTYEENNDLFLLHPLNCHPGISSEGEIHIIHQCNAKEGIEFTTLEEAKIYLDKYVQKRREKFEKNQKVTLDAIAQETKKEYYIEKTKLNGI